MTTAVISNKASREIKKATAGVRSHFDVFERARNIYLTQIKKAESDYYERIKRATAILSGEAEDTPEPPQPAPVAPTQEAAN